MHAAESAWKLTPELFNVDAEVQDREKGFSR
jgi:hypothetical protein